MRRSSILLPFVLALAALPAPAQEVEPVPRLVYFAPLESNGVAAPAFLESLPEVLYTSLVTRHELIRVRTPQEADSVVRTVLEGTGAPGEYAAAILLEGGPGVSRIEERFRGEGLDGQAFRRFVDRSVGELVPLLPKVDPQVRFSQVIREQRLEKAIQTIDFAERLERPFQLTLWAGGRSQSMFTDHDIDSYSLYPLQADLAWYPQANLGVLFAFSMRCDDFIGNAKSLLLLPGLGLSYRTLGRVAGQFDALLYMGAHRWLVELTDPDHEWGTRVYVSIRPGLEVNLTPRLALKTAFGLYVGPEVFLTLFQAGLGFRW